MTSTTTNTAGIDTSKLTLDIAVHAQPETLRVPNTQAGFDQLLTMLRRHGVQRVGIEATGGYERPVTAFLRTHGLAVDVLQPKQVKAFAALHLQRAKSDRIDARLIAACTHLLGDRKRVPPDPRIEALADHLTFIEQIEEDVARLKTRLEHITNRRIIGQVRRSIAREQLRRLTEIKRLLATLTADPDLAQRYRLVLSVPAVGERTALALVIRMPELGQVSREQAAALAGLAPFVHQSGKWSGQTHIGGGRAALRRSLFMAAFAGAHHWNPDLVAMRTRLIARGKAHTSAIIACARKLLITVNAVVARATPWQDRPQAPA